MARDNEWLAYYDQFPEYFAAAAVRDGCHPRIMEHSQNPGKAIVLVHGLTDSPYYLTAIGEYFFQQLGYNVYLPLLHCHGLKVINSMAEVDLIEWKANVRFAIDTAAQKSALVSIGGLSTGATLGFYMACTKPRVTGDLYLFSAALELLRGHSGFLDRFWKRVRHTFVAQTPEPVDELTSLVGVNPYRYARMDKNGVQQLVHLIGETDDLLDGFDAHHPFPKRVFAAHTECDARVSLDGIRRLQRKSRPDDFALFLIDRAMAVAHASVVLEDPVYSPLNHRVLEKSNPVFVDMMAAISRFEHRRWPAGIKG